MQVIILSDIHANVTALNAVITDFKRKYHVDALIILGDLINYGMSPNQTIETLQGLDFPILVNLHGNHENSLFASDLQQFSTDRGREILNYTKSKLSLNSWEYIKDKMNHDGYEVINVGKKKILCIHGNLTDPYWGKINSNSFKDRRYESFDYVISGHTHIRHYFEYFYKVDNPKYRNKKRIIFLNPGSVGQPRNHNPNAQYAFVDFSKGIVHLNSVKYDIIKEQKKYSQDVDSFYSYRLLTGI